MTKIVFFALPFLLVFSFSCKTPENVVTQSSVQATSENQIPEEELYVYVEELPQYPEDDSEIIANPESLPEMPAEEVPAHVVPLSDLALAEEQLSIPNEPPETPAVEDELDTATENQNAEADVLASTEPAMEEKTETAAEKKEPEKVVTVPVEQIPVTSEAEKLAEEQKEESPFNEKDIAGLWNDERSFPYIRENSDPRTRKDDFAHIKPSRSVTLEKNQILTVDYPGSGWIFLGEKKSVNILRFVGRQISNQDTLFTLRAIDSGKTLVHFYKQDLLKGNYIDDYLEVIIEPAVYAGTERKTAPSFASLVPYDTEPLPAIIQPTKPQVTQQETTKTVEQLVSSQPAVSATTQPPATPDFSAKTENSPPVAAASSFVENQAKKTPLAKLSENLPEEKNDFENTASPELLSSAKEAQKKGDIMRAVQYLDAFLEKAEKSLDEGWFLRGQLYEANSELKNIRTALDSYERLIQSYPSSVLWKNAQDRITYLKKFYFNIR